jgi:hypothetical protein
MKNEEGITLFPTSLHSILFTCDTNCHEAGRIATSDNSASVPRKGEMDGWMLGRQMTFSTTQTFVICPGNGFDIRVHL